MEGDRRGGEGEDGRGGERRGQERRGGEGKGRERREGKRGGKGRAPLTQIPGSALAIVIYVEKCVFCCLLTSSSFLNWLNVKRNMISHHCVDFVSQPLSGKKKVSEISAL